MSTLPIVKYPDPRLRETTEAVRQFDDSVHNSARNLVDTLRANGGIGLSGPQIGDMRRIFVVDMPHDGADGEVYINPEIVTKSTPGIIDESCLSLPGIEGKVVRHTCITVRAQDATGETFEREVSGMHAVCVQHEIDHLDGILFVDKVWLPGRWRVRGKLAALARRGDVEAA